MKRDYRDYILDVIESIKNIEKFTKDMKFEDFECDEKSLLAVVKSLEIIGEAAKKIPSEIKKLEQKIPWKKIVGMRDKLVHEYFGINKKVVWRTIKEDISNLKPIMEKILKENNKNKNEKLF